MRALVLGAGGMAGHMIALRLSEKGHDVTGIARRPLSFCDSIVMDITDTERLQSILTCGNYDFAVNAVGVLQASIKKNTANGIWINSFFPHWLSKATKDLQTQVIHLSTDCVFSGLDGGDYNEKSLCNADDYYGRSKALGELNDEKNLTFRTSIIGPDINLNGTGLFHWFMRQTDTVSGYCRAVWTGITTLTLADAIEAAAIQRLTGLYHLVNNQSINKYELLQMLNKLRKTPISIIPSDEYVSDKSLTRTRCDFDFFVPEYGEMISSVQEWIDSHHCAYQHYSHLFKER